MAATGRRLSLADEIARTGGRKIRRYVNESIYRAATRGELDRQAVFEFVCECGHLDCAEVVRMPLERFDASSSPGAIIAHDAAGPYRRSDR